MTTTPESIGIIAGRGAYPLMLAESARKQGVKHIVAVAFKKETRPGIEPLVDETHWITLGQYGQMLKELEQSGVKTAVMAGQITPTHLFRVRLDAKLIELLKKLKDRNAETIFGAIAEDLQKIGIELMHASMFMESHMPPAGLLSKRAPTESEAADIELGLKIAKTTSKLDIGQTVVIKEGTVLAVEAFEGTDDTILRAGTLGGPGSVVVKVAKPDHDMRFDIPVVGLHTLKVIKKAKATALALEAGRAILLDKEELIKQADKMNLCLTIEGRASCPSEPEATPANRTKDT